MLVLEDLHWADPDTLDVLSYLADAASTSPVVLVATARDELDPPQRLLDLAHGLPGRHHPAGSARPAGRPRDGGVVPVGRPRRKSW